MRLAEHRYKTVTSVAGPLLFVERVVSARIGEEIVVMTHDGRRMDAEVLEIEGDTVLVQVYGETQGLDIEDTSVIFTDSVKRAPLSTEIIGRCFNGSFRPIDNLPLFVPDKWSPVTWSPINPSARAKPSEFIETGISAIDGLNTLIKGQKLPIFSCSGLPSKEVTADILKGSKTLGEENGFIVVFTALGLTFHEYSFYMRGLEEMRSDFVAFINMADEPVMERLLAPRFALTVAEYLAFEHGMDVVAIITDMTNYCDALREISTARKELPGRRGYPGYMYSDLASLYERAGRIKGKKGSITMIPVLTMPEDDITHPIPDLTGYITEGQIVLSREMHQRGIYPPIDVLSSLSRLMQSGIGKDHTREDHRKISRMLYKYYAKGRDLRKLEVIIGREGMAAGDQKMLDFTDTFEHEFLNQGRERRDIFETLDTGLDLLKRFSLAG
jgi:V/A-type H+-transporting ATPase subunit B